MKPEKEVAADELYQVENELRDTLEAIEDKQNQILVLKLRASELQTKRRILETLVKL